MFVFTFMFMFLFLFMFLIRTKTKIYFAASGTQNDQNTQHIGVHREHTEYNSGYVIEANATL